MKIVFATGNKHKLKEAQEILGPDFELVPMSEVGVTEDIPETGSTIAENSRIKAEYLYKKTGLACFADDTGLEVAGLNGEPGIYAARYSYLDAVARGVDPTSLNHDFDANIDVLLRKLREASEKAGKPADRSARFLSVITLIREDGSVVQFEGEMKGRIGETRQGCEGFGYDPVFIADDYPDRPVAALPSGIKNTISHRYKALMEMEKYLKKLK